MSKLKHALERQKGKEQGDLAVREAQAFASTPEGFHG